MQQLKDVIRICVGCGSTSLPQNPKALFCTSVCKIKHYKINKEKKNFPKVPKSDRVCPQCNVDISDRHFNTKFCTPEHRYEFSQNILEKTRYASAAPEEYIECLICGSRGGHLISHLQSKHSMTVPQYYEKFPGASIVSPNYHAYLSDKISGDKNPAYQHGGKYSPFSDKFINAASTDKQALIERAQKSREQNNNETTKLSYYTSRGLSTSEAEKALSERQSTFSKEICIQKYGTSEGIKRWEERQEKWLKSLDALPEERKKEISKNKVGFKISKQEKVLLEHFKENDLEVETQFKIPGIKYIYDFKFNDKLIEVNGDYWHCNPSIYAPKFFNKSINKTAEEKWKLDAEKVNLAKQAGFQIITIWENDFLNNPQQTIDKCLTFLKNPLK